MPSIRPAEDRDLDLLAGLEDASDSTFASIFDVSKWGESAPGRERAAEPGFILVSGDPPVGFAHVLDLAGHAYLEQVSVHPDHGRQGIGGALVEAVCREAAARGHTEISLRTFADVPWNGPFYARHGFAELAVEPDWMTPLREAEEAFGLGRHGRRVAMSRRLSPGLGSP